MSQYTDKVVVVTGASGSLGQAVAQYFETRGARVARLDIEGLGRQPDVIKCDLFDDDSCAAATTAVLDQFGGIDILTNVAGGFAMGDDVHETKTATWELMHKLNTGSVVNMARNVVPVLLQRPAERGNAKIINVAARAGLAGAASMGAYVASKSAVIRLTETMAEELKTHGINVNCVMPSIIDTPPNREAMPDANFADWVTPASIAAVIGFLASEAARDLHGAAIPIAGLS